MLEKIKLYLKKIFQKEINAKLINDTATTISKIRVTEEAQKVYVHFLIKKKLRGAIKMIPKNISIYEVGPRDGLQNEKINISLENKIKFINLLTSCNYANIEIGSLVSSKWVPQMKNSEVVFNKINKIKTLIILFLFLILKV